MDRSHFKAQGQDGRRWGSVVGEGAIIVGCVLAECNEALLPFSLSLAVSLTIALLCTHTISLSLSLSLSLSQIDCNA